MKKSVYIIDSEENDWSGFYASVAFHYGCLIKTFDNFKAFLDNAAWLGPAVVFIRDAMLAPNGLDVVRDVNRVAGRNFAIIIVSSHRDIRLAVRAGARDFLVKPLSLSDLKRVIDDGFAELDAAGRVDQSLDIARRKIEELSPRERAVLTGLIEGHSNKVIANELRISPRTVEIHRAHMMSKLSVRSVSEAMKIAFQAGIVNPS